jgi:hypothetical protein
LDLLTDVDNDFGEVVKGLGKIPREEVKGREGTMEGPSQEKPISHQSSEVGITKGLKGVGGRKTPMHRGT